MFRQGLRASAALGAVGLIAGAAFADDLRDSDANYFTTPVEGGGGVNLFTNPPERALGTTIGFSPDDFADVGSVDLDVARIAGALGFEVDARDAELMGRVSLRVVNDPVVDAPPDVRDPSNWLSESLDGAGPYAPVSVHDVRPDAAGVAPRQGLRLDYVAPVARRIAGDLEVAVAPRANVVVGRDVSGVGGGAVVRFGRNLTRPRHERSRWYAFVGADAQALTWSLGARGDQEAGLRLEDKQLIGDAQAGVAMRLGAGDLSLGFVHREIKYKDAKTHEQFVGLSYSITR